jgi:DNA primase
MLRRYAKRVVLMYDSDIAGMEAANRALEVCLSQRLDIKLGFVPEGKDPCDFLLAAGKEAFDRVIEEATDVLQFKWDRLRAAFEGDDSLASRRTVLNEFLQAVATGLAANNIPMLDSGLIVNKLSKIIGLTPREINADLSRRMGRVSRTMHSEHDRREATEATDWGRGLHAAAQREVLEVLVNEPELFHDHRDEISESLFDVPLLRQMARVLLDALRSEGDFSFSAMLARVESVSVAKGLVELQSVGEEKGNYASRLADAIEVLRRYQKRSETIGSGHERKGAQSVAELDDFEARPNPHSLGLL